MTCRISGDAVATEKPCLRPLETQPLQTKEFPFMMNQKLSKKMWVHLSLPVHAMSCVHFSYTHLALTFSFSCSLQAFFLQVDSKERTMQALSTDPVVWVQINSFDVFSPEKNPGYIDPILDFLHKELNDVPRNRLVNWMELCWNRNCIIANHEGKMFCGENAFCFILFRIILQLTPVERWHIGKKD